MQDAANLGWKLAQVVKGISPDDLPDTYHAERDITPWEDCVRLVEATHEGPRELPVLGTVEAPTGVLVRPDGYVARVGKGGYGGLPDALTTWFGPPNSRSAGQAIKWAPGSSHAPGIVSASGTYGLRPRSA